MPATTRASWDDCDEEDKYEEDKREIDGAAVIWSVIAIVAVFAWYLSFIASRMDRLHHRVETSWAALDAALQRRASVSMELAISGLLDPAQSVLLTAASHDAREAHEDDRAPAEEVLGTSLATIFADEESVSSLSGEELGKDLIDELAEANRRVEFAMASFNDAVESARIVRSKFMVRLFRLAGRATLAQPFNLNLEIPTLR